MWALGTNFYVPYYIATRLVARLRRATRRAAMAIPHAELIPICGGEGETSDLKSCINKALCVPEKL